MSSPTAGSHHLQRRTRTRLKASREGIFERALAHPLAFLLAVVILTALVAWPYISSPERSAPFFDAPYYSWRMDVLLSESPAKLVQIGKSLEMFGGGYRVSTAVIGAVFHGITGVPSSVVTLLLMIGLPVITALLLAGFAYRQRKDALLFHVVAVTATSLLLTIPFASRLDNLLCLAFLAVALYLVAPSRVSWAARLGLVLLLVVAGVTHPTTLAVFCLTLGLMSATRLLFRRSSWRSVVRNEAPMLLAAAVSATITYAVWRIGIWGEPASFGEAAVVPSFGQSRFVKWTGDWVHSMFPFLTAPLALAGGVTLLSKGARWVDDELARVSIVWLFPFVGLLGALTGGAFPYHRLLSSTLAYVLLVGVGAHASLRLFIDLSRRSRASRFCFLGAVGVLALIGSISYLGLTRWSNADESVPEPLRTDLEATRRSLSARTARTTPVVFIVDRKVPSKAAERILSFVLFSGNRIRLALPTGQIDEGYLYLGTLDNYLAGRPTVTGSSEYDELSNGLHATIQKEVAAEEDPVVVLEERFNLKGANAGLVSGNERPSAFSTGEVWVVRDGTVRQLAGDQAPLGDYETLVPRGSSPLPHRLLIPAALIILLVTGALALRLLVPDAGLPEALGAVPALALALIALAGTAVLAGAREPLSSAYAWTSVLLAAAFVALLLGLTRRHRSRRDAV